MRSRAALVAAAWMSLGPITACGGPERNAAPDYSATLLGVGDPVELSTLRGEAVLLAGWATWCVPCERELPELQAFADGPAPDGLRIVAVNVDTDAVADEQVGAMAGRLDLSLPIWRDPSGELLTRFEGTAMPFSVLIDRDGAVVRTWNGALDVDDDSFIDAVADAVA